MINGNIFISIGTNEGVVLSYQMNLNSYNQLKTLFSSKDHTGYIKNIRMDKKGYLVTCSKDETIFVYNYLSKKSIGSINSSVGSLSKIFLSKKFIITSSEDGFIYIHGKKDMQLYEKLNNKRNVIDMDLKNDLFLLVLTNQNKFSIWDLTELKCILLKGIKVNLNFVRFLNNEYLLLAGKNTLYIYSLKESKLIDEINVEEELGIITNVYIYNSNIFFIPLSKGSVLAYNYNFEKEKLNVSELILYTNKRIKEIKILEIKDLNILLFTITSEGNIDIYEISTVIEKIKNEENLIINNLEPLLSKSVELRLITLDVILIEGDIPTPDELENNTVAKTPKKPKDKSKAKLIKKKINKKNK